MPPREWLLRIEDILGAIRKIREFTKGLRYEAFANSPATIDAVLYNFVIIGEAARFVPESVQSRYVDVPWEKMRGMRHFLVHEYFGADLPVI